MNENDKQAEPVAWTWEKNGRQYFITYDPSEVEEYHNLPKSTPLYTHPAQPVQPNIQAMVSRFLGWKLPMDFAPDCGISIDTEIAGRNGWPSGTNLFNAEQAKQMFEYVTKAQPVQPAGAQEPVVPDLEYTEQLISALEDNGDPVSIDAAEEFRRLLTTKPAVAQGEPVAINPIQKRRVFDYIRGAYDLGYNDARDAKAVPGDSAPGYQGRSVEKDHGEALIHAINCTNNAPAAAINEQTIQDAKRWQTLISVFENEIDGFLEMYAAPVGYDGAKLMWVEFGVKAPEWEKPTAKLFIAGVDAAIAAAEKARGRG